MVAKVLALLEGHATYRTAALAHTFLQQDPLGMFQLDEGRLLVHGQLVHHKPKLYV